MKNIYKSPIIKVVRVEIEEGVAASGTGSKSNDVKTSAQPDSTRIIIEPYKDGGTYEF